MNVLLWLTRDLRLTDHPALAEAARLGRVLAVFVADPADWAGGSGRQWAFVAESLTGLRAEAALAGLPVALRIGPAAEALPRLCRRHAIAHVCRTAPPGGPQPPPDWLRAEGIGWSDLPEPAPGARVLEMPPLQGVEGVEPGPLPHPRALGLAEDRCPNRQEGGRAAALACLDRHAALLARGLTGAPGDERAASRLSPHLAWGTVSAAEVGATVRGGRVWRGLQARAAARAMTPLVPPLTPLGPEARALVAGETGLPFVDAAARYLRATGWLSDPARRLLAEAAIWQLGLDAAQAGAALAGAFTDHDAALFWPAMARAAAARPANPVREGQRLDPTGAFLRRWLPELRPVPDAFLHRPWAWPGFARLADRRYPLPRLDPARAPLASRAQLSLDL